MEHYFVFDSKGFSDYCYWQGQDKKILSRINRLIQSIQRDGKGIGKAEVLKGDLKGCLSRRIDNEHRLVYQFSSNSASRKVLILSCKEHYDKNISSKQKSLLQSLHI